MNNPSPTLDITTLLASAIHDMKNSLAIILNTIDELEQPPGSTTEQSPQPLTQLRHEGQRLNNQFIQMLALYRIHHGRYSANINDTSIYELLEQIQLENHTTLAARNIRLTIDCDGELVWFCDRALLLGAINTIINNAYTFARQQIHLSATLQNQSLIINIDDDGPGYPAQMLTSDPQPQRPINFQGGGTGLGIYFASAIAHLHQVNQRHGHITLSNHGPNGGGRFTLCLP